MPDLSPLPADDEIADHTITVSICFGSGWPTVSWSTRFSAEALLSEDGALIKRAALSLAKEILCYNHGLDLKGE